MAYEEQHQIVADEEKRQKELMEKRKAELSQLLEEVEKTEQAKSRKPSVNTPTPSGRTSQQSVRKRRFLFFFAFLGNRYFRGNLFGSIFDVLGWWFAGRDNLFLIYSSASECPWKVNIRRGRVSAEHPWSTMEVACRRRRTDRRTPTRTAAPTGRLRDQQAATGPAASTTVKTGLCRLNDVLQSQAKR